MCLCCGSFGKGPEGQLIMCSQCGQSYHPYCVGVKVWDCGDQFSSSPYYSLYISYVTYKKNLMSSFEDIDEHLILHRSTK